MSGEPIYRPEFDLYVRMSAEANEKTSKAIESIAESHKESIKENRETNQILREYIIHNNQRHDETNKRLTAQGKEMAELKELVKANSKVTAFALSAKKGIALIIAGALTAAGGYWSVQAISDEKKPDKQIEKANP